MTRTWTTTLGSDRWQLPHRTVAAAYQWLRSSLPPNVSRFIAREEVMDRDEVRDREEASKIE
jgi:hypothetical protein